MQNLSSEKFEEIFENIFDVKISDEEIKKFLLDLNDANLPLNAFIGAVSALKKRMKKIVAPIGAIDVCGTGGDKLNTLNISTAVCFVVAGAGVSVAKHGNKAISSLSGSADIFSELGIKISSDISEIEKKLRDEKLCFLFAPFFHESLKNLADIRKSLNAPTIFNFLGPLLNPANTSLQLIGVSRKDVMKKMIEVCQKNNAQKIYIVHGMDKMDEISICADSYLLKLEDGKISEEEIINPTKYGFRKSRLGSLIGKDPKYNAEKLMALLNSEKSAYRDIVVLNSAFALKLADKVKTIEEGVDFAKSLIDDGSAISVLHKLQNKNV